MGTQPLLRQAMRRYEVLEQELARGMGAKLSTLQEYTLLLLALDVLHGVRKGLSKERVHNYLKHRFQANVRPYALWHLIYVGLAGFRGPFDLVTWIKGVKGFFPGSGKGKWLAVGGQSRAWIKDDVFEIVDVVVGGDIRYALGWLDKKRIGKPGLEFEIPQVEINVYRRQKSGRYCAIDTQKGQCTKGVGPIYIVLPLRRRLPDRGIDIWQTNHRSRYPYKYYEDIGEYICYAERISNAAVWTGYYTPADINFRCIDRIEIKYRTFAKDNPSVLVDLPPINLFVVHD